MITIVDYGAGNLDSVAKAFAWLGHPAEVTSTPEALAAADKIVLPGVGHFSALSTLARTGLATAVLNGLHSGKPFLGICLGMQWLFDGSDESPGIPGAGVFSGICRRFPPAVKSPHVGWNSVVTRPDSHLLRNVGREAFVYYSHSFHAPVITSTTAESDYGLPFSAVVERDNIFGVQFHPEKSGDLGLSILETFCEMRAC
jgi:imidazole glycerol-phosphate synthase subunit HisH